MGKYKVIDGNEACAHISYMFTEIAGIYPITPASPMSEYIDKWSTEGRLNLFNNRVKLIEMQSEAGAIALVHGSLQTGSLASTYTASQGLLLMIPSMYKIAGEMLPCVINVASRTVATHALSIFGDHSDIYASRSTGFCFLASSSVEDTIYMTLASYLSTLKGKLPFVNFFDGFRTSHELNKVYVPDMSEIKGLVPFKTIDNFRKESMISKKQIKGTTQNDDVYFQNLEARNKYYDKMPDVVNECMEKINKKFKTDYKPFNYYGDENAEKVIVAMGSVCDALKELVDVLNAKGEKVGVLIVHLFRPFSKKYFLEVLPKKVRKIAVLDRAKEAGAVGEPLYEDVVNIFNDVKNKPFIIGGRYGISSKDTNLEDLYAVFKNLDSNEPINSFTIGIVDDVTGKSLKPCKIKSDKKNIEMLIYGYGSDGMISASKDIIKTVGTETEAFVQGYFEYDSKKSGGITVSHLRIGKEKINMPYYITNPHIVVCTKDVYLEKYDMLSKIRKNGIFILVTDKTEQEIKNTLSNKIKYELAKKNVKFYIIDAYKIAKENNIPNKISMIMENAIENLLERFKTIRAGRANPAILDGVKVEYYGTPTSLNQLATVSVPEARRLQIKPFDKSCLANIEKAIFEADLGLTPNNTGELIFIAISELTEDRRREFVKQAKTLAEEAKIALRNIRQDANNAIKKDEEINEDMEKSLMNEVQDLINDFNKKVDEKLKEKEEELMTI